jgi:hypothetical protein
MTKKINYGSIVFGWNEDGEFVKKPDGTLICTHKSASKFNNELSTGQDIVKFKLLEGIRSSFVLFVPSFGLTPFNEYLEYGDEVRLFKDGMCVFVINDKNSVEKFKRKMKKLEAL